jgi:hypothetical protein
MRVFWIQRTNYNYNFDAGSLGAYTGPYNYPTNYAYAGLNQLANAWASSGFDPYLPFEENCLFRNFVYSPADIDAGGNVTNVTLGDYYDYHVIYDVRVNRPPQYQFQTNGMALPDLLSADTTRWLLYDADDSVPDVYSAGIVNVDTDWSSYYTVSMPGNLRNWFGLPYVSTELAWGNTSGATTILNAGHSVSGWDYYGVNLYPETAQPQFQTVEYDFFNAAPIWDAAIGYTYALPGNPAFSPTNTSQQFFISVGKQAQIAGYAKLAVQNGYAGVYAYLGQYFDKAYKMTNGVATTNTTGVLSPNGYFFATEPGPTALVTMPDLDPPYQRGTCTVYTVSAVIDRSQASNMDLSFNGANATSLANPAFIWCNNNYDRWFNWSTLLYSEYEQDDLGAAQIAKLPAEQVWPDCQYTTNGFPAIPCPRDLEDYFRLWLPGVAAAMKAMPANYSVQLTLSGDAQIRIFQAIEPDGGTNYLFDEVTASNQVNNSISLYVGLLTSNSPVYLTIQTNFNEHFIFCGAHTGSAQIDLQILDPNQNVVADAPAYLQIKDIKQMYERWTVGDNSSVAPLTNAILATDNLPTGMAAFRYTPPTDTSTPYILLVHGYNMKPWEKDRYAETAYKRLYWQGYQGRFGALNWPTAQNPVQFGGSELQAWASAQGLLNKLNDLNAIYPGQLYLTAHSLGNVVAGEALRLASNQVVNTYVAMQGAVAAHAYDPTTPAYNLGASYNAAPDCYAHYWTSNAPCYFNGSAGAGVYVNFYNPNDWALTNAWLLFQKAKPTLSPSYSYNPETGIYYKNFSLNQLSFPTNTYELFDTLIQAPCYALGMQPDVKGAFQKSEIPQQIDLQSVWPLDAGGYKDHVWHSAEFRSDSAQRWQFWNQVLVQMRLK